MERMYSDMEAFSDEYDEQQTILNSEEYNAPNSQESARKSWKAEKHCTCYEYARDAVTCEACEDKGILRGEGYCIGCRQTRVVEAETLCNFCNFTMKTTGGIFV